MRSGLNNEGFLTFPDPTPRPFAKFPSNNNNHSHYSGIAGVSIGEHGGLHHHHHGGGGNLANGLNLLSEGLSASNGNNNNNNRNSNSHHC